MTQTLTSGHSRLVLFSPQQKEKEKFLSFIVTWVYLRPLLMVLFLAQSSS